MVETLVNDDFTKQKQHFQVRQALILRVFFLIFAECPLQLLHFQDQQHLKNKKNLKIKRTLILKPRSSQARTSQLASF